MNTKLRWNLDKYASLSDVAVDDQKKKSKSEPGPPKWQFKDCTTGILCLILTESHQLIVTQDKTIQKFSYRFRVKFAASDGLSGADQCTRCAQALSKYFTLKLLGDTTQEGKVELKSVTGDTTLPTLAKVVSGQLKSSLPLAYRQTHIPTNDLETFLRVCLTDVNFPAFVEDVEKALKKLAQQN